MAKTILLADDSVTIQKVVELTFMDEDYEVVATGDGEVALERLPEVGPDLVIADVHMPKIDGYEVCRQAKERHPGIPVLLLVGTFEQFDEARATEVGADGHLKKPFDSQDLLSQVETLTARYQAAGAAAGGGEPAAVESPSPAKQDEADAIFGVDEPAAGSDLEPPTLEVRTPVDPTADTRPTAARVMDEEPTTASPAFAPADVFEAPEPATDTGVSAMDEPAIEVAPAAPEPSLFETAPGDLAVPSVTAATEAESEAEDLFAVDGVPETGATAPTLEAPSLDAPELDSPDLEPAGSTEDAPVADFSTPASELATAESDVSAPDVEAAAPEVEVAAPEPVAEPVPSAAEPVPSVAEPASAGAPGTNGSASLSDEDVDRIAKRVAELMGEKALRDVAWEVVPDLAEVIIKERIRELESQVE
ncbi:MAG: response regulator [Acidobacteriota bacterium]